MCSNVEGRQAGVGALNVTVLEPAGKQGKKTIHTHTLTAGHVRGGQSGDTAPPHFYDLWVQGTRTPHV